MEHIELIESAISSYLTALTPAPWQADLTSEDGVLRIFIGEGETAKDGACIVVSCDGELTEDPPCSGNRWASVNVELRTPVLDDEGASLAAHKLNSAALTAAVMDVNFPDLITSEDLGFTCFGLSERNQYRDQTENAWISGHRLKLYSAPSYFA